MPSWALPTARSHTDALPVPGEEAFFEGPGFEGGAVILLSISHGLFSLNPSAYVTVP